MRELHRGLKRLSGWQKGLLVAANNAQLCIYGTSSLSQNEVYQIRESVRTASEKLLYHAALEAEQGVRGEISNVQTSYLQLRPKSWRHCVGFLCCLNSTSSSPILLTMRCAEKGKV